MKCPLRTIKTVEAMKWTPDGVVLNSIEYTDFNECIGAECAFYCTNSEECGKCGFSGDWRLP